LTLQAFHVEALSNLFDHLPFPYYIIHKTSLLEQNIGIAGCHATIQGCFTCRI